MTRKRIDYDNMQHCKQCQIPLIPKQEKRGLCFKCQQFYDAAYAEGYKKARGLYPKP